MMLNIGQELVSELFGEKFIVSEFIGGGGQGEVYRVAYSQGSRVVKWYTRICSTKEQKESIKGLILLGVPEGARQQFIWPIDIVTKSDSVQFGYLMPLVDRDRYGELGEIQAKLRPVPDLLALSQISYKITDSFRALHMNGLCYRDISPGNLLIDPITADVLICDNDNIGINKQSQCQITGTMEYMAPEIVRGEADPSTETDQHSLAVLLFNLWMWHHPFHGMMEYTIRCLDIPAKKRLYGINPVFIFDPENDINHLPGDPEYIQVQKMWDLLPETVRNAFIHAFTVGLSDPKKRVTETQWRAIFAQLIDGSIHCPSCRAINLWEYGRDLICWHDKKKIPVPPKLAVDLPEGRHYIVLRKNTRILGRHLRNPRISDQTIVGSLVQHPKDPSIWGIRNETITPWRAIFSDKDEAVPPGRSVPIKKHVRIDIGGTISEIIP